MTEALDQAQEFETLYRDQSLRHQLASRPQELPDEDEHGRYCLSCGLTIPLDRLEAAPNAVRCVPCQAGKEHT
ncbi:conjugal transfer protein TraR [Photobacterium frigidiphilum]|uniref:Conjugal transfer protein TraR n=1 Tax=Photobacterium frigidiphilum TaxID=264736 RepID=A0A2T3JKD3_9GAMM|nr:TraR/DksA C4-type zinc finger protein [Photobacterium frigidiphilum]PSU49471.1 conjugal transfer protein TraR [Photobacterium frigidiphilum]